jgi:hypothetical protein
MFDAISVVLGGIGLVQNAGSGKAQRQMAETLENIRDILKRQSTSTDLSLSSVPQPLWLAWRDALQRHTIILTTGCHQFSEIFDRPTAYALKFAIDQFGQSYNQAPLYTMVMGDHWFYRDDDFSQRPFVLSVGGPRINTVTERIVAKGKVVHRGNKWTIAKRDQRYAIYGDDPADTLTAMKAFAEHELVNYLDSVWGKGAR